MTGKLPTACNRLRRVEDPFSTATGYGQLAMLVSYLKHTTNGRT
jgi:hypothetical protein